MRTVVDVEGPSPALASAWDGLADELSAPPFLRPGWVERWWRAFGRGRPGVAVVRGADGIDALVPLARIGVVVRSPSNWHTPIVGALARPGASQLLAARVARAAPAVLLRPLDASDPFAGELVEAATAGRRLAHRRQLPASPFVDTTVGWAAYEGTLDAKLRREIRRRRRRLGERGAVSFEVHDGMTDLDRLLADGFAVEAAGWKRRRGTALEGDAAARGFYRSVSRWAAERGILRLAFLRLDAGAIAFDLALEEHGVHYLLKTGYDEAFSAYSPGTLLRETMLRRAFDLGLRRYEFLGADAPWKRAWTTTRHERIALTLVEASAIGAPVWLADRYVRPIASNLRRAFAGNG